MNKHLQRKQYFFSLFKSSFICLLCFLFVCHMHTKGTYLTCVTYKIRYDAEYLIFNLPYMRVRTSHTCLLYYTSHMKSRIRVAIGIALENEYVIFAYSAVCAVQYLSSIVVILAHHMLTIMTKSKA